MLQQDTLDLFGQDSVQDAPREKEPVELPSVEGGGLYVIRLSEKHYYGGRTSSFSRRWESHLKDLIAGNHGNPYMQGVFNKFGMFEPEAVKVIPNTEDQVSAEQAWLDANIGKPGCVNLSPWASGGCSPDLLWVYLGEECARVPPERVPELLAQGWARGRVGGSTLGRVVLTRNRRVKLAPPEEVGELLTQGWIRGLPDRLKGLVSVRSPEGTRRKVSPEKAQELLAQGWERGPGELPSRNWVHRTSGHEIERKQISDADLQDFLNQGWAQGSALPNTAGLLWIRKEGEPGRRILGEDLECFLGMGWELGQGRFLEPQTWIRRPKEEGSYEFRMVPSGELAVWEQQGWEQGYLERTPEVREKVVASWTPEKREAARLRRQTQENTTRGSVWVNDGVKNKRVSEEGALQLVAEGWQRGQIHRKAHGPMSEESRARVSEAHRKSWARRGGMSEEGKQNLREKALQRHAQTPEKWATSDEKRAACSRSSAGRTWLTDGVHNKFASPEEAGGLLGSGWVRGQARKSA